MEEQLSPLEQMRNYLIDIQNSTFQVKILNLIYSLFEEVDSFKNHLVELEKKVNEIVGVVNIFNAIPGEQEQKEEKGEKK